MKIIQLMKKVLVIRIYSLVLMFSLLVSCYSHAYSKTEDEAKFDQLSEAFRYWLEAEDSSQVTVIANDKLKYYCNLVKVATFRILMSPGSPWKVDTIAQYDIYGKRIPVRYVEVPIDNFGHTERVPDNGSIYFIRHQDYPGVKIIVSMNESSVDIYSNDSNSDWSIDFERRQNKYITEKNFYRAGVLEMNNSSWPHCLMFLTNVDDYSFNWNDLIMDPLNKRMCKESTTDYLGYMDLLKTVGVNPKKGLLLYGPPGTGKSFLGQLLITETLKGNLKGKNSVFILTARHLMADSNIGIVLKAAKELSPSTIFMEDIDLLGFENREEKEGAKRIDWDAQNLLNELLNGLDGLTNSDGVLTIATTNKPENIDPALLRSGRLGLKVYFGLPKYFERKEFFERFGRSKVTWESNVTSEWLASETEGFSGADIVECISLAKQEAYLEGSFTADKQLIIKMDHFQRSILKIKEQIEKEIKSFSSTKYQLHERNKSNKLYLELKKLHNIDKAL